MAKTKRQKTWRDIGNPKIRHRLKVQEQQAIERAAKLQQQQTTVQPLPFRPTVINVGGKKFGTRPATSDFLPPVEETKQSPIIQTGGKKFATRPSTSDFWATEEFKKYVKDLKSNIDRPTVAMTSDVDVEPDAPAINFDERIKAGDRLYYDPHQHKVTNKPYSFIVKGGTADRPEVERGDVIPLFVDLDGNMTTQNTGTAAIWQYNEALMALKAADTKAYEAAKELGYSKTKPAKQYANLGMQYVQSLPEDVREQIENDYQKKLELWREANKPLVAVGYTANGEPFYWDERDSIKNLRDAIQARWDATPKEDRTLPRWGVKTLMSGALFAYEKLYEPLIALGDLAVSVKEFIESPAIQQTSVGRAVDVLLSKGAAILPTVQEASYRTLYIATNLANKAKPPFVNEKILEAAVETSRRWWLETKNDLEDAEERWRNVSTWLYEDPYNPYFNEVPPSEAAVKYAELYGLDAVGGVPTTKAEREAFAREAMVKRDAEYEEAFNALFAGDIEIAMRGIKQAVIYDIQANPFANPYSNYTWKMEPDKLDNFLNDIALLTVQKGAPLNLREIRRIKQYHENVGVELLGELVFDPLNLPVIDMVSGFAVNTIKRALKFSGEVAYKGSLKVPLLGDVIGYLGRQTTSSTANEIARVMNNALQKMLNASGSTEDFRIAMREVVIPALDNAAQATDSAAIDVIYNEARAKTKLLDNISLDEFLRLKSHYDMISGPSALSYAAKAKERGKILELLRREEWSKLLDDSFANIPDDIARKAAQMSDDFSKLTLEEQALRIATFKEQFANTPKFAGAFVNDFAYKIGRQFSDYHRIFSGGRLFDDSLAGKFASWLQKTTGTENAPRTVEHLLSYAWFVKDVWTMSVLSLRPAWIVQNLTDTIFRHSIYGGSIWDDLKTLFFSTQAHLADELGVVPIEFSQSLARANLDYTDTVAARLLYENWKPKAGLFSFWGYERKRLKKEALSEIAKATNGLPVDSKNKIMRIKNWFQTEVGPSLGAIPGAAADLNTSIEFTIRLRMFNREYFDLLRKLEPGVMRASLEEVPESVRGLASQIWQLSKGNPAKIKSYVNSLEGAADKGRAYWSFIMPPDIQKSVIGMTAFDQENFLLSVRTQLDNLITSILKTGREPTADDFKNFIGELISNYRVEVEERLSQAMELRRIQSMLPADKAISDIPELGFVESAYRGKTWVDDSALGMKYTNQKEYAAAMPDGTMGEVISGEIRLNKPFIVENRSTLDDLGKAAFEQAKKAGKSDKLAREASEKAIRQRLLDGGYDGVIIIGDEGTKEIVTFFPKKQFIPDEKLNRQIVAEAANRLNVASRRIKPQNFIDDYTQAMKGVADVKTVPGNRVTVTSESGIVTIEIGEELLNITDAAVLKERLGIATRSALYKKDAGYIKAKGLFLDEVDYTSSLEKFARDPGAYLQESTAKFEFLARQLIDYPTARRVIESLRGRRIKFESAHSIWEKFGRRFNIWVRDEAYAYLETVREILDEIHTAPADYRLAADLESDATVRLGRLVLDEEIPLDLRSKINTFRDRWGKGRELLRSFYKEGFPGPRSRLVGTDRHVRWEKYYSMATDSWNNGARIKNELAELIESGQYEKAGQFLDDWEENFTERFISENGIAYELSSTGDSLFEVSVTLNGRKVTVRDEWTTNHFIAMFLSGDTVKAVPPNPRFRSGYISEKVWDNTYKALYDVAGMTQDEADAAAQLLSRKAEEWSNLTGRPIEEYFSRLGINEDGIGDAMFGRLLVYNEGDGSASLFGLFAEGETALDDMLEAASNHFLQDLKDASVYSKKASREFNPVKNWDEKTFTKNFLSYVNEGKFAHKGQAKTFEAYKEWLASSYRMLLDTPLESRLDDSVNRFLANITREVDMYPHRVAEAREIRVLAGELGLKTSKKEVLRIINNDVKEVADATFRQNLDDRVRDIGTRFEALRGRLPERPNTFADGLAEQGRIGQATAEYIGQRATNPINGVQWDDGFIQYISGEIERLPHPVKVLLEERMLEGLENPGKGFNIYLFNKKNAMPSPELFSKSSSLTEDDIARIFKDAAGFVWDRDVDEVPFMGFFENYGNKPAAFAHELVHYFYKDIMENPVSREVAENLLSKIKKEADEVLKRVRDPRFLDEIQDAVNSGTLKEILTATFDRFSQMYSFAPPVRPDLRTNEELAKRLYLEISALVDDSAMVKNLGKSGLDRIEDKYMLSSSGYSILAMYLGIPNGQFLSVSLLDAMARENNIEILSMFPNEEILAYSIERFSLTKNEYTYHLPLFEALVGKEPTDGFKQLEDVTLKYGRDALHRQAMKRNATYPISNVPFTLPDILPDDEPYMQIVHMTPDEFMGIAPTRWNYEVPEDFLIDELDVPIIEVAWDSSKEGWHVISIDGRMRAAFAKNVNPNSLIPVQVVSRRGMFTSSNITSPILPLPESRIGSPVIPRSISPTFSQPAIPPITIVEEMDAAWKTWSAARDFRAFGSEADRATADSFRDYLRRSMLGLSPRSNTYEAYRSLLWQVEQMQDAVLKFHKGDALQEALFPHIPEAYIDDGMKTWIRNNEYSIKNLEAAERALKDIERFLVDKATGKDPTLTRRTSEEMDALRKWADSASSAKADLINTVMNGDGKNIEGAVDKVNRVMLDYQTRNNFDSIMSNIFPFWMFPSRSWPFWVETLAAHPKLIALYGKMKRASQSYRFQAGAVNSRGEPLPSLEGYIPISLPGMKEPMWINPLAPLSFRYVLSPETLIDDLKYELRGSDYADLPPMTSLTKSLMENSAVFGFYTAPWLTYGVKRWFNIPDHTLPQFPALPQISLIPRWRIPDMIRLGNKTIFTQKDLWYPEASWHDYLVERDMLRDALSRITNSPMSTNDKRTYIMKVQTAIAEKGNNPMWQEAYRQFTEQEANKSLMAYFTGMFSKDFSDSDADLYALRNEMNFLKSAIQNDIQMRLFDLEESDEALYQKYIDKRNTPEGWLYSIYTDIGWVTNEQGLLEKDPLKRAKLLATRIEERTNTDNYWEAVNMAYQVLQDGLRSLPIGAPNDMSAPYYEEYARAVGIAADKYDPSFQYFGTSKSTAMIAEDMTERWFDYIWKTKPVWNPLVYESYEEYEARFEKWKSQIPDLSKRLLRHFRTHDPYITKVMSNLKETQQLPDGFFVNLQQNTTFEAIEQYRKDNKDDVFDALNKAWEELYWNPYWDTVSQYSGHEREYAEMKFLEAHPHPPSTDELYSWITQNYGDRFQYEEVKKWVTGSNSIMNYEERFEATASEAEKIRNDIWDILSWIEPGSRTRDDFEELMLLNGVEQDFFTKWYDSAGKSYDDVTELKMIQKAMISAATTLQMKAPDRQTLAEWAIAQRLNNQFRDIVASELPDNFQNVFNAYNKMERDEKLQMKREHPEWYDAIREYYNMKDAFAAANPLWAKFYNPKKYKPGKEQLLPEGSVVTQGLKIDWPKGMKDKLDSRLVSEIERVYTGGSLSPYARSYMELLAQKFPSWRDFVSRTIYLSEQ